MKQNADEVQKPKQNRTKVEWNRLGKTEMDSEQCTWTIKIHKPLNTSSSLKAYDQTEKCNDGKSYFCSHSIQ